MCEASFGDVTAEYLSLRESGAVVRPAHEVVWVRGADAVPFLDGLLSQDVAGIPEGRVARSFLLEPRGKLVSLLWVLRGSDEVGLIADPGGGEVLAEALTRFRFRVDASIEPGDLAAEVWGPAAGEMLTEAGVPVADGWTDQGGLVAAIPLDPLPRYLVPDEVGDRLVDAGVPRAGTIASSSVRIEAGEPMMGVDVDQGTIPQETGLVGAAVSFTKGCYLGQELVARIDSRGRVNRHLRGVVVQQNIIPPLGARVLLGDAEVGILTSVGESLTLRAPVGLAMLRREAEPGTEVSIGWDGGEATALVKEVPLDDFSPG